MKTGWMQMGDKRYYLKENGVMAAGESMKIEGKTYRFASSGVLQ